MNLNETSHLTLKAFKKQLWETPERLASPLLSSPRLTSPRLRNEAVFVFTSSFFVGNNQRAEKEGGKSPGIICFPHLPASLISEETESLITHQTFFLFFFFLFSLLPLSPRQLGLIKFACLCPLFFFFFLMCVFFPERSVCSFSSSIHGEMDG